MAFVLAQVEHEGREVMVVHTLDSLYLIGKRSDESLYVIPSDEEMDAVGDTIEELVVEFEERRLRPSLNLNPRSLSDTSPQPDLDSHPKPGTDGGGGGWP